MTKPVGIFAVGMVTSVGLSAPATCAAIRCGINNFRETLFFGESGKIVGGEVRLEREWTGTAKLAKMATMSVRECLGALPAPPQAPLPVVLCLAEEERPGRLPGLGGPLLQEIERDVGTRFHADSSIVAQGRVGGAVGLLRAQKLLYEHNHPLVVLLATDSYFHGSTLAEFERCDRLLTPDNSDGFIPGEAAAAAVLVRPHTAVSSSLVCSGIGFARERATRESDEPLRGEGMVQAVRAALAASGIQFERVDHRISDLSGEQYRFKEVALVTSRILREHKPNFGLWHPADCIGEVGAAAVPALLGVLHVAAKKRYLPGTTLVAYLSNDDDKRAALIVSAQGTA